MDSSDLAHDIEEEVLEIISVIDAVTNSKFFVIGIILGIDNNLSTKGQV